MVITGLPRYVNERKLGIVIRHEKICLTVDDQQVGSICQAHEGVSCGMSGSRCWARCICSGSG